MKNFNFDELPLEFHPVYVERIYDEIINDIVYDDKTIDKLINIFIESDEFEKCQNLKKMKNNEKI